MIENQKKRKCEKKKFYINLYLLDGLAIEFTACWVGELVYGQNGDKSKRRHRNGDRNGYIQNGDKPKQHL